MSLHSQLLRGLLALPVMLLLAIAGVIAPDAAPSSPLPASDPEAATSALPAVAGSTVHAACPRKVVRIALARG